jgi:hypothetical protein
VDVTELLEYKCRLLAIAGRVVRWIHRIYDSKLRFVLLCHWKRVEGPIDTINSKQLNKSLYLILAVFNLGLTFTYSSFIVLIPNWRGLNELP